MAHLTLDSPCSDSYSECSSSSSSSSYGILTPTSSIDFSAATSRRQSIVSEVPSCNESTFERVPSFSSEGLTTPLQTPPPFRLTFHSDAFSPITQGYQTEPSPTGIQRRRRLETLSSPEGTPFQDPFASQIPYFNSLNHSGFDGDTQGASQQQGCGFVGPRPISKTMMDWSTCYNNAFVQSYDQADPACMAAAYSFDASSGFEVDYVYPDSTLSDYRDLVDGLRNGTIVETDLPQTVAPQETFMPAFRPSTPISQHLEAPFQTPMVKSEPQTPEPGTEEFFSPCSSLSDGEPPVKRSPDSVELHKSIIVHAHSSSRRLSRSGSSRVKKKTNTRSQHSRYPYEHDVVNSNHKAHVCPQCKIKFDRPEHFKRHKETQAHDDKCRQLGVPTPHRGPIKAWKCRIDGCKTAVTRKDNLKPHYQKTHFFRKPTENKKRNIYVSIEDAEKLGLQDWDPRRSSCTEQRISSQKVEAEAWDENIKSEVSDDDDMDF